MLRVLLEWGLPGLMEGSGFRIFVSHGRRFSRFRVRFSLFLEGLGFRVYA